MLFSFIFTFCHVILIFFRQVLTFPGRAAQLAYMMEDRLKDATEEADKERALKDIAEAAAKEKVIAAENAKARAQGVERDQAQAEQQRVDAEVKLGEAELRVAGAESIVTALDKEIVELKVALDERENKYYNMGFNDA